MLESALAVACVPVTLWCVTFVLPRRCVPSLASKWTTRAKHGPVRFSIRVARGGGTLTLVVQNYHFASTRGSQLAVAFVRSVRQVCRTAGSCFFPRPPALRVFWARLDSLIFATGAPASTSPREWAQSLGGPRWPIEVNAGGWIQWPTLPTTSLTCCQNSVCPPRKGKVMCAFPRFEMDNPC